MTMQELYDKLYELKYPKEFEVDAETFGNLCKYIFDRIPLTLDKASLEDSIHKSVKIYVGKNRGILYKNVEIICK